MNIQPFDQTLADVSGAGHGTVYTAFPIRDERLNSFRVTPYKVHTRTRGTICECYKEKHMPGHGGLVFESCRFVPVSADGARAKVKISVGVPPKLTARRKEADCVIRILAIESLRNMLAELLLPGNATVRFRVAFQEVPHYYPEKIRDAFLLMGCDFWRGLADRYEYKPEEIRTKVLEYVCKPGPPDALATPRIGVKCEGSFRYVLNCCSYSLDIGAVDTREIARICNEPDTNAGVVRVILGDAPSYLTTQLRVTKACGTFALEDARKDPGIIGLTAKELEAALRRGGKIQNPDIDSNVLCCNGKHYMQLMATEIVPRSVEQIRKELTSVPGVELVDATE